MNEKDYKYSCSGCGACCRWKGYVRVSDAEIDAIADFLGMAVDCFIDTFTRITDDRRGLSLLEREDFSCIFLTDDNRCMINGVKPKQCRDFPNVWNFSNFELICRAEKVKN